MNEIKELLQAWQEDGLTNPDALAKAYTALLLIVQKIEDLEKKIES